MFQEISTKYAKVQSFHFRFELCEYPISSSLIALGQARQELLLGPKADA